ncbi:5'-nucleotidase [Marilutibacter chinensis]|uniref:5'-nucleotidase n=1 Tax=Marilutibacter chinensis TaxID=2912247 RepID=A0ABS9HQ60_9GAMM|nr:5'-nucleotidase [Lysobacter chinensis]MCF7220262.1 5'-nucleotidase [Lysobacter chinensis]
MPDANADPLIVAISSRTLFDLEDSHALFEAQGIDAYADYQREHEDDVLTPGVAFPLVRKLLGLNDGAPPEAPRVEVILISRNSADTGLRIFNSIAHHGLSIRRAAFAAHERARAGEPLSGGPFRGFLDALHRLQAAFPVGQDAPIRTALVTARSIPAHERVIRTLREWGIRLDEALFLGGRAKGPFLEAFGADIFFDDSVHNIESARGLVAAGHVPHGIANRS